MTIEEIRENLTNKLNDLALTYGETSVLTQLETTDCTDELAGVLDTVNPNGPCYPPSPR